MQEIDGNELVITVNGNEVWALFNLQEEETFDPTDAVEYLLGDVMMPIGDEDEVCVKFNPMQYEGD